MKRLHLHVSVPDLSRSISFYETLFGAAPTVVKPDYAKWMLEDPAVNFAISERAEAPGLQHLGIQVDSRADLSVLAARLKSAGARTVDQEATTCCYARSDKTWVNDPSGLQWETFYTLGEATTYGDDAIASEAAATTGAPVAAACCLAQA